MSVELLPNNGNSSGRSTPDWTGCLSNIVVIVAKLQELIEHQKTELASLPPASAVTARGATVSPLSNTLVVDNANDVNNNKLPSSSLVSITSPQQHQQEVQNFSAESGAANRRRSSGATKGTAMLRPQPYQPQSACACCKMYDSFFQQLVTIADELEVLAITSAKLSPGSGHQHQDGGRGGTPSLSSPLPTLDAGGGGANTSCVFGPSPSVSGVYPSFKVPDSRRMSSDNSNVPTTWYRRRSAAVPNLAPSPSMRGYGGSRQNSVYETDDVIFSRDEDDNKVINGYAILGQLGKGQYGKVKLAEHQETKKLVAMKIIQLNRFRGAQFEKVREKVSREIAVMKQISHPNLVKLLEVLNCVEKGKMYLVLQYVPNGPVAHIDDITGECECIAEPKLKQYALQMVNGLIALHRKGIFHRDVKPDNMLIGDNDALYIADFGVSVICSDEGVEGVEGTPAYMSPELCRGDKSVSGDAVDAWALGVTLYQLMYGKLPFIGETPLQLTRRIVNSDPVFPTDHYASPAFVEAVRGLLNKDQDKRLRLKELSRSEWLGECNTSTSLRGSQEGLFSPQKPRGMSTSQLGNTISVISEADLNSAIGTVVEEEVDASDMLSQDGSTASAASHRPALWNSLRGKILAARLQATSASSQRHLHAVQAHYHHQPKTPPQKTPSALRFTSPIATGA